MILAPRTSRFFLLALAGIFVAITPQAARATTFNAHTASDLTTMLHQAHHFWIERCYLHAYDASTPLKRGVGLNSAATTASTCAGRTTSARRQA
jgi:hypothetical protein